MTTYDLERFRRAQEPEPWTRTLPCKAMRNSPVQFAAGPMAELNVLNAAPDEDCLSLNVWAPETAAGAPVFGSAFGASAFFSPYISRRRYTSASGTRLTAVFPVMPFAVR